MSERDPATPEAIAEMALQWAKARDEAVATFGCGGADRHQLEAAWARLGRAERALLDAVRPLREQREDEIDCRIAAQRLAEGNFITGAELDARLKALDE